MNHPGDLLPWLLDAGARKLPLHELFAGFCDRLAAAGPGLTRATLALETLHPELSGTSLRWREGRLEKAQAARAGILTSESYLKSPVRVVDETERPFRWRAGEDTQGMALLEELAAEGTTDYLMLPLPFLDTTRTAAVSYATRRPGGFAVEQLALLEEASLLLSPWAERVVLRRIALDLLEAYLGREAGRRVYDGQIERGDVRTVTAAIWFCDLRGFTALSDRLPRPKLVGLLNRWFEVLGAALEANGGEILKFMGDGLLAVFHVEGGDAAATCARALAAAEAALAGTAELEEALAAKGEPPLRFGLALHLGEVGFGNIGTPHRLDFTVVGPAVNAASRIEALTKELGHPVLASAEFAALAPRALRPLGAHPVRGIAAPVEVFALA